MDGETPDPVIGLVLGGRYKVESLLGEGGMGRVYVARHEAIGKTVAVKCLNPEMTEHSHIVERFKREARAATSVGSPHIIDVTDMGELPGGAPYIVMELLKGVELGEQIEDHGPMPIGRAVRILMQACDGLEAAHAANIIHRDLKPENLFIIKRRGDDFVKILDFGISKFTEHANGANQKLTQTGMTMGTPTYMSPEQAQGKSNLDHRTDIYSLGCILFEMLTGEVPFLADSFALLLVRILTHPAPPMHESRPDVPPGLEAVVQRCLEKDMGARFPDCGSLREALKPFANLDEKPVVVEPTKDRATVRPPSKGGVKKAEEPETPSIKPVAVAELPRPSANALETGPMPSQVPPEPSEPRAPRVGEATRLGGSGPHQTGERARLASEPGLPTSGRGGMIAAGVALAVFGVGATTWAIAAGGDEDPEVEIAEPPVVNGEEPASEVRLRVVVAPGDATITLDGQEYPNPLDAPRPRSLDPVRLRISREGYVTYEELVVLDRDREILKTLERAPDTPDVDPPADMGSSIRSMRMRETPMATNDTATTMEPSEMETSVMIPPTMETVMDAVMTTTPMTEMTDSEMDGFRDDW